MRDLKGIVADLRSECSDDYVGVWQIFRALADARVPASELQAATVEVVSQLLLDPLVAIGQFHENVFIPWADALNDKIRRLHAELQALGRVPDIGEVAWLVEIGASTNPRLHEGKGERVDGSTVT